MLSIESLINISISFLKRFSLTFYTVLFKSKKIFSDIFGEKIENYTQVNTYFVLSILVFIIDIKSLESYRPNPLKDLFNLPNYNMVLYTVPLGLLIYFLIFVFGKLLKLSGRFFKLYEIGSLYWIATTLLTIVLVSHTFFIWRFIPENYFFLLLVLFLFSKALIALNGYFDVKDNLWRKFLLIPVFAISPLFIIFVPEKTIERFLSSRNDLILLNSTSLSAWLNYSKDSVVTVRMDIYLLNTSNKGVIIEKSPFAIRLTDNDNNTKLEFEYNIEDRYIEIEPNRIKKLTVVVKKMENESFKKIINKWNPSLEKTNFIGVSTLRLDYFYYDGLYHNIEFKTKIIVNVYQSGITRRWSPIP